MNPPSNLFAGCYMICKLKTGFNKQFLFMVAGAQWLRQCHNNIGSLGKTLQDGHIYMVRVVRMVWDGLGWADAIVMTSELSNTYWQMYKIRRASDGLAKVVSLGQPDVMGSF
jgi:hypothetical protein